jgi:hypothetical protein
MANIIGSNRRSVFAVRLAAVAAAALAAPALPSASRAAGDCLAAPSGQSPTGQHWFYRIDRGNGRKCWYLAQVVERAHRAAPVRHSEVSHAAPAAHSASEHGTSSQSQHAGKASPDETAWKSVDATAPSDLSGRGLTTGQAVATTPPPSPQRSNPFAGWPDPAQAASVAPAPSAASTPTTASTISAAPAAPAAAAVPAGSSAFASASADAGMNNPAAQEQPVARPVTAAEEKTPAATAKAMPAQDVSQVSMVSLIIGFAGALLASALAAHFILKVAAAWRRRTYLENRARQTMRPVREPFGGNEPNLMAVQVRNRPEAPRRDFARGLFPNESEQRARPDALRELLAPLDRDTRPRR